jgi:hypothetical protein
LFNFNNRFGYFTRRDAPGADPDAFGFAVNHSPEVLKIWFKPSSVDTGNLLADAAFFLGQTPIDNRIAGRGFFAADLTNPRHIILSFLRAS